MTRCTYCENLSFSDLVLNYADLQPDQVVGYRHQPSFAALEESAKTCELCQLFTEALRTENSRLDGPDRRDFIKYMNTSEYVDNTAIVVTGGTVAYDNEPPRLSQITVEWVYYSSAQLGLFAEEGTSLLLLSTGWLGSALSQAIDLMQSDDPAAVSGDVVGRKVDSVAASDINVRRTVKWIQSCLIEHPSCMIGTRHCTLDTWSQPLPTRLLRIDATEHGFKIKLFKSEVGQKGCYIALSHCWGLQQIITTTSKTMGERVNDIPLSSLSKTFQDAVYLSTKIGVQYLWIDSLCIIQDSKEDWERESSNMGLVYQNAVLTIAATAASNGTVGCFVPRPPARIQPIKIRYDSEKGNGNVYINSRASNLDEDLDQSPLNKRAWTLQERLLSKRILHCCEGQLYWECQTSCISEAGLEVPPFLGLPRILDQDHGDKDIFANLQSPYWKWMRLLEVYTERDLTKDHDKLPALSGLANEFAKRTGDEYLAGIWRRFLPTGLLWEVKQGSVTRRIPNRAPSWSWASIDGRLGMHRRPLRDLKHRAEVLDASTTPLGHDKYGQVTDGTITLRSKISSSLCCDSKKSPLYTRHVEHRNISSGFYPLRKSEDDEKIIGYFAPDESTLKPSPQQLALLIGESNEEALSRTNDMTPEEMASFLERANKYVVLFIEPVDESKLMYGRIGMGIILTCSRCFDQAIDQVITLI